MPTDVGFVRDSGPIAYFLTWTTHGSWLPGDARGWTKRTGTFCLPNEPLLIAASRTMTTSPVTLSMAQRRAVHHAIHVTCGHREWTLHACQCRTQHVHVVVSARNISPKLILAQLKAWTTRRLMAISCTRSAHRRLWTRGGSARLIYGESALARVIEYVAEAQDRPRVPRCSQADRP